jgi:RHS repeat-associated protein
MDTDLRIGIAGRAARPASATARTVSLTAATNTCTKFLQVLVLTGANLDNPIGVTNIGPPGDASAGVLNQSVTSSAAGSMAFAAVADWQAQAVPTPAAGVTLAGSYHAADATGAALYQTAAATGPGQTMTIATTAPSTAKNSWAMFEVMPAGTSTSIFGPGWTAPMPGPDAGTAEETLTDNTSSGGFVTLTDETGVQSIYTATSIASYPYSYTGVGDTGADGTKLTKDSATQFTLTDIDGTKTVYTAQTVGGVTVWRAGSVVEPGTNTTSTFTTDTAGRTTRILAPVPAGVTCTTLVAGCRALTMTYATSVTATGTGTSPATWGDYTGRLTAVAMALNGATPVTVAAYAYDLNGRLRSATDPRTSLATTYSYDTAGRLSTITPPGQATWALTYDTSSRISTASRPAPVGGTATTTVAYDIPITGTGAPIDMSAGQVAGWAQTDLPVYAAGVFSPDHVPASPPLAADWPYADLTYLDTAGRGVNTASYGNSAWQITTTEHDAKGNPIRTLSAENRNQALAPTADTDPTVAALTTSAARSQLLDGQTIYAADGVMVTDAYGPTHPIVDDSGAQYSGREHTHTDYDQGAPTSPDPYRLATTITSSVRIPNGSDLDVRRTVNGYAAKSGADANTAGWVLRKPTTVTTWMGGGATPDIVHTTYYDLAGNTVEDRQPAANSTGTDAYTTLTTYYTATGSGGCVNASFTGLACTTGPAAQPSTGNPLPVTTYTYNNLGEVLTTADAVTVSGTTTTRTTTDTYDTAGRKTSEAIAVSPAANGGTTIPTATYGYDSTSGLPTTTTASSTTLTTGYNSWGQVSSQTDVDGNSSTSTYDLDGRVSSEADGKGTYSYVYDGTGEHRGLRTSLGVGAGTAPSTFAATYDGDGKLTSQTYPNGLVAATRYDNVEQPTSLTYAKSGSTWLSFSQTRSVHGQVRRDATPPATKTMGYDNDGRLTSVIDAVSYGGPRTCTTRLYSYNAESDRTALTSYPDAGGQPDTGNCSTSTSPTGYPATYDQADRLTTTGYTYDLFGRTTTDPYTPSGSSASLGYYVNDLVASETVGTTTRAYTLDPARRFRSWTDSGSGATSTNHYTTASGDDPAWIATGTTTWTRNITGIDGSLAALQTDTGTVTLQITNLHGDTVSTVDDSTTTTSIASYTESTEFGLPYFQASAYPRYGWLGAKERSHDTLSGLTLMGVRLYNPDSGRFDQTDPIPGGSANSYDYCNQDPVNCTDIGGTCFEDACVLEIAGVIALYGILSSHIALHWHPTHISLPHISFPHISWAKKKTNQDGKATASDVPSWAKGNRVHPGETTQKAATRIWRGHYGRDPNASERGPGSEWSKIRKRLDRNGGRT